MTDFRFRLPVFPPAFVVLSVALFLAACGKSTVRPVLADPGFELASLRTGTAALIVDGDVRVEGFHDAFASRFGSGDSLAAFIAAELLDSLNGGKPVIVASIAPALNPRFVIHVRNLIVERRARELPATILPTGGQQAMAPAGGGTSESCAVTFDVEVWEQDSAGVASENIPEGASGVRRLVFSVTGLADVPLYAYKTALVEAVNMAARRTARHLRGE
jgi:hypothetical protein